ncbi:hypothetical protein M422DRAFT_255585 [Sphaerobolus stellatus SS14]|uniref:Unplaced genomic scaffold SPHSTscaffold_62, whole genome shotgun sequence n=1 Tax=Sphaerobolus stellatus (strain SS14) TaxID=990650 RepID=A0A0C9V372_SPHS4|nr:hypothetical protein M422DRAFT_255585 [Sphaerobolus stellatus SS14]
MLTISPDTNPQRILQQLTSPSPRGGVRFVVIWCMSGAEKSIRSNVSHFLPSVCMILTLRCLQQLFRSWNGIHGRSFEEPEHQPSLSQATLARKPAVSGEHQILQPTDKYEVSLPHPLLLCQIGEALGVHSASFMEHLYINSLADASLSRVPDMGVPQATPF